MLCATRQNIIYDYIRKNKEVNVNDLTQKFDVTDMTIRRDLSRLQNMGLIKRTHGGAVIFETNVKESSFVSRSITNLDKKKRIAAGASELIGDGLSIFIDGSTTGSELAMLLPAAKGLTIFTNSLAVLSQLKSANCADNVIVIGGELSNDGNTFDGAIAVDVVSKLYVDLLFFSCGGFNKNGISNTGLIGTQIKKSMLTHSKQHILLADSTKYDSQWLYMLCDWSMVDVLISDSELDTAAIDMLKNLDVELILK